MFVTALKVSVIFADIHVPCGFFPQGKLYLDTWALKRLSFNKEVKYEHDSETPPPSVSQCSFKMDRGTVENFFLENMDILRTEEESKHLYCYQFSAACHQDLFDVMEIDQ